MQNSKDLLEVKASRHLEKLNLHASRSVSTRRDAAHCISWVKDWHKRGPAGLVKELASVRNDRGARGEAIRRTAEAVESTATLRLRSPSGRRRPPEVIVS